ncbi:nostrin-like [Antedon mediterranea]|uniref:nostrin-like n=1 Tax=Antedon mediterranea TaxID=105859 RepID=UPI003AF47DC9
MTHFQSSFIGANGYTELKKFMKRSTDFSKEFINILGERAEIELSYAKGLAKLSNKISKSGKECIGSLAQAWTILSIQIESESELHKKFSDVMHSELAKPYKTFLEQQIKGQKSIDSPVEKAAKVWTDKKQSMAKAKKNVISKTKDCELMSQQIDDSSVKKPLTEKELNKLQSKTQKAETVVVKADSEHIAAVKNLESARHDLECAVRVSASQYQGLQEERFVQLKDLLGKLSNHMSLLGPNLNEITQRICQAASVIDPDSDIEIIATTFSTEVTIDQVLYDSYEEDMKNTMKVDRRRTSLLRKLKSIDQEIYKEQKTKEGIKRLSGAYGKTPGYADEDTKNSVTQKIHNSDEMIDLLEASKYKLHATLALLDRTAQPVAEIGNHIKKERDKQGFQNSILRRQRSNASLPPSRFSSDATTPTVGETMNEVATHQAIVAVQGDQVSSTYNPPAYDDCVYKQAIAKYDYDAQENDELTIKQGDVLKVLESMDDGWSKGELNGQVGVFPTSYI